MRKVKPDKLVKTCRNAIETSMAILSTRDQKIQLGPIVRYLEIKQLSKYDKLIYKIKVQSW